ncbi:hypothetical protein ACP70R_014260 [Stipagrostis hirtigluma subsp. patula]
MAGEFVLKRCSSKAKGKAVAGGAGPMKGCSTKRKAKAATGGEKGPIEGCITKRKAKGKAAASFTEGGEEPAGAVVTAGDHGEEAPAVGKRLTPLPAEEVELVLSRKREYLTSGESTAEGIEAFDALSDSFAEYQAWMREEYEANGGVVLVDDEFLERRAEHRKWMQDVMEEVVDDIDFSGWKISDRRSDFYDDESDEEGEEVVQEPETN